MSAGADGATALSDLEVWRHDQPDLFGGRGTLNRDGMAHLDHPSMTGHSSTSRWPGRRPLDAWAGFPFYVIDMEGPQVTSHSDLGGAAPRTSAGTRSTMVAALDATGEPLVTLWRPGSAGSGAAFDPLTVLDAALALHPVAPCPGGYRPDGQRWLFPRMFWITPRPRVSGS